MRCTMLALIACAACTQDVTIIDQKDDNPEADDTSVTTDDSSPDDSASPDDSDPDNPPSCEDFAPPALPEVEGSASCQDPPEPGPMQVREAWRWSGSSDYPDYDRVGSTPVVINLDEDEASEVLFVTWTGYTDRGPGVLRAVDGATGEEQWSVMGTLGDITGVSGVAAGRVNGEVLVFVCTTNQSSPPSGELLALDASGHELWITDSADTVCESGEDFPALHRFEEGGEVYVIVGRNVVSTTGAVIASGQYGRGGMFHDNGRLNPYGSMSFVADVNGDGVGEIIVGDAVYDAAGAALWHSDWGDGSLAVADIDGTPGPELIVNANSVIQGYRADTGDRLTWAPMDFTGERLLGGPPTIADHDTRDPELEFGFNWPGLHVVYNHDGTELWRHEISENSGGGTGSTTFDFEGDGLTEVIIADQDDLWILDGRDGAVRLQWADHDSGTVHEYPVIVDVDADDEAEIVFMSNDYFPWRNGEEGWTGITMLEADGARWMDTSRAWNQYAYYADHVDDQGEILYPERPHWETHNSFRSAVPTGWPVYGQPDLEVLDVVFCEDTCEAGAVRMHIAVANVGAASTDASTLAQLEVLDGSRLVGAPLRVSQLEPGEARWLDPIELDLEALSGDPLTVWLDPSDLVEECDLVGNTMTIDAPCEGSWSY